MPAAWRRSIAGMMRKPAVRKIATVVAAAVRSLVTNWMIASAKLAMIKVASRTYFGTSSMYWLAPVDRAEIATSPSKRSA